VISIKRDFQIDLIDVTWSEYKNSLKNSRLVARKYHFEEIGLSTFVLNPIIENSIDVFFFIEFTKNSEKKTLF
jgi:hypothetical protein